MSNLKLKVQPTDYRSAMKALGGELSKVIGHNTKLEYSNGDVYAMYHDNAIVRYDNDGSVWASWAGWATSTTTNRLNMLAPGAFRIQQRGANLNGAAVDSYAWHKVS